MSNRRPYNPAGDALGELEHWMRKYYRYEVSSSGDGDCWVKLSGGGRHVYVDETMGYNPATGDIDYPTIGQTIHEAIRLWHADATVKQYQVFYKGDPPTGIRWQHWGNPADGYIMAYLTATGEQDAIEAVRSAVVGVFEFVELWERATVRDGGG